MIFLFYKNTSAIEALEQKTIADDVFFVMKTVSLGLLEYLSIDTKI